MDVLYNYAYINSVIFKQSIWEIMEILSKSFDTKTSTKTEKFKKISIVCKTEILCYLLKNVYFKKNLGYFFTIYSRSWTSAQRSVMERMHLILHVVFTPFIITEKTCSDCWSEKKTCLLGCTIVKHQY